MVRHGYIIEKIIEYSNMVESFDYVMRGNSRKKSRGGKYLMEHKEEIISKLQHDIGDGSYCISSYREYTINEIGKERIIQCIPLSDRIALNAIMRVVESYLNKRFIADTAASIRGRGGHYLHKRMMNDINKYPEETRYMYKMDIKKFYHSINQDVMMFVIKRFFKDKKLIDILERCVKMLPEGLSIGLRSSQALGNLLLSYYLDHVLKDIKGYKFVRRYCDDICVQADSFHTLTAIIRTIKECIGNASLEIKSNEQLFDTNKRDIDFLGYRVFGNGKVEIRKHIKQRFSRRWKRVKSNKRKRELAASFYGIAKHANAKRLFKKITGIDMNKFSEMGLVYIPKDGKKRFNGEKVSLSSLINTKIKVIDYEVDIKTPYGGRQIFSLFQIR